MPQGQVTLHINAPPMNVYALVADIPRMGEWSPECRRTEWVDGYSETKPGARFRGHNKFGIARWTTTAEIESAEPGRELVFSTLVMGKKRTRWRYRFDDADGGTDVTESHEPVNEYAWPIHLYTRVSMPRRDPSLIENMRETLSRIKAVAERS